MVDGECDEFVCDGGDDLFVLLFVVRVGLEL